MSDKKATIQDAINARACYSEDQLKAVFGERKALTAKQIAKLNIPHKDKVWALTRGFFMDKEQCVIFSVFCAEQSLHFFEEKCPNDNRPRKAIEAAKNWIKNKTAAAAAAYAAYAAAAYAADAYAYAAYAAYAAAAATHAAAAAAAAANAYAAYAAAAAAYAAAAATNAYAAATDARAEFEKAQLKKLLQIIYAKADI